MSFKGATNGPEPSRAGRMNRDDWAGVAVETGVYTAGEEVVANMLAGADTAIHGVGGSLVWDLTNGDWRSIGLKAVAIAGLVTVRRLIAHQGTCRWVFSHASAACKALVNLFLRGR